MRRSLLMAVFVLLAAACGSPPLSPDASGEEVYAGRCAGCHGDDLEGGGGFTNPRGPSLGPGSQSADRSDAYYVQTITRGQGRMPPVRGLTDAQIERVIAYIRSVQSGG
ncbi:MAG: c-type cytochrome [Acidimicrobiia bacterium]